jgi:hypothetical protein
MRFIRIGGYPMDLAMSEGHNFPGQVSEYPPEQGADISDHIRDMPPEITLECIVSDTPVGDIATDPTRTAAGLETPLQSTDALEKLREMKALRKPITIETSLGVFESMAFVDLDVPKDAGKSGGLFFTARFKKVVVVTNRRVKVRVRTAMPTGSKVKAVAATNVKVIDKIVLWRHGIFAGSRVISVGGIERVEVSYSKPPGLSRDEALAFGHASPGSSFITYFREGSPNPIVGADREDLVQDLLRDQEQLREQLSKTVITPDGPVAPGPNEFARQARNLPPELGDLSRFQRPPQEPTIPTTFNGVP